MYTVTDMSTDHIFDTFEEVIAWAWNTHKITLEQDDHVPIDEVTELTRQLLCGNLSVYLQEHNL